MEEKIATKNKTQHPALIILIFSIKILLKIIGFVLDVVCEVSRKNQARNTQTTHDMMTEMSDQDPSLLDSHPPKKN